MSAEHFKQFLFSHGSHFLSIETNFSGHSVAQPLLSFNNTNGSAHWLQVCPLSHDSQFGKHGKQNPVNCHVPLGHDGRQCPLNKTFGATHSSHKLIPEVQS